MAPDAPNVPAEMDPIPSSGAERRKGFFQGVNASLACLSVLANLWVGLWSIQSVPRFRAVFEQVRVELPVISMVVVQYHAVVAPFLILAAGGGALATLRWSDRKEMLVVNIAGVCLSLAWLALASTALFLPLLSLLEGIGRQR